MANSQKLSQVKAHYYAKRLRQSMTDAEKCLWFQLRDRRLGGLKFRRQYPIGPFIADFACVDKKLVVEVDGSQHNEVVDARKNRYLAMRGWRVLRFWNNEVLGGEGVELVLGEIYRVALGG